MAHQQAILHCGIDPVVAVAWLSKHSTGDLEPSAMWNRHLLLSVVLERPSVPPPDHDELMDPADWRLLLACMRAPITRPVRLRAWPPRGYPQASMAAVGPRSASVQRRYCSCRPLYSCGVVANAHYPVVTCSRVCSQVLVKGRFAACCA